MSAWRPSADLSVLQARARMLARIRAFFDAREVMEVETPFLSRAAVTDPALHSLRLQPQLAGRPRYLHTSPEFPMKRLLAAGSGDIYQICRVFRDGEQGRRHNIEFSLLEWYRLGWDYHQLMAEVAALLGELLGDRLQGAPEWWSYAEAFAHFAEIEQVHSLEAAQLKTHAQRLGLGEVAGLDPEDRDAWCDLILSHRIEPQLGQGRLAFLYDYPVSQAALARVREGQEPVAERFEVYFHGMELGNGFRELTDAAEQRRRFEADLRARAQQGLEAVPLDEAFLQALSAGLPECSGVALGLDRILMAHCNEAHIHTVLTFDAGRA